MKHSFISTTSQIDENVKNENDVATRMKFQNPQVINSIFLNVFLIHYQNTYKVKFPDYHMDYTEAHDNGINQILNNELK